MKKIIAPATSLALLLGSVSFAHAQIMATGTPLTPAPIESDFGHDLHAGVQETAHDENALKNQQEVKDTENLEVNEEGDVRNGQEGVDQQDLFESQNDLNQERENVDHGDEPVSGKDTSHTEDGTSRHEGTSANGPTQEGSDTNQ